MRSRWGFHQRGRPLDVAHLAVDAFDDIIVDEQLGDVAVPGGFRTEGRSEAGSDSEEAFSQRDGQVDGVRVKRWGSRDGCAG